MSDGLYQITLPYLCAGIEVAAGRVVDAAPILAWTRGKPVADVARWARGKGGRCVWVTPSEGQAQRAAYEEALAAPRGSALARETRTRYEAWAAATGRPVARPSLCVDAERTARLQGLLRGGYSTDRALPLMETR